MKWARCFSEARNLSADMVLRIQNRNKRERYKEDSGWAVRAVPLRYEFFWSLTANRGRRRRLLAKTKCLSKAT